MRGDSVTTKFRRNVLCNALIVALAASAAMTSAYAQEQVKSFDVPMQPAASGLNVFAEQADITLVFSQDLVAGVNTKPLKGSYSVTEGLDRMLEGTRLSYRLISENTVAISTGSSDAVAAAVNDQEESTSSVPISSSSGQSQERITTLEEIVVTGTNVRGVAPVGSPVQIISREELLASGRGRVQDFLETVPQNFSGSASEDFNVSGVVNLTRGQSVDLRGLGPGTTLTLVNGRRQAAGGLEGAFIDISSIPVSAVERLEILTDGASAIYGSEAIGGVVNFVLRDDFEGAEVSMRSATFDGHGSELQADVTGGLSWPSGNLLVSYQYSHRDPLMKEDTFYGAFGGDFRQLGGTNNRANFGNPGTILNSSGLPVYAIPEGQNGQSLTVADLIPGQINYRDDVSRLAYSPEQETQSALAILRQSIGESVEVFAELRYAHREMEFPSGLTIFTATVPSSNPFYVNPFPTSTVRVAVNLADDMGVATQLGETETYAVAMGGRIELPHDWEIRADVNYARELNEWAQINGVNTSRLNAALADANPATALNVFGDGAVNNPSTINFIRQTDFGNGESVIRSFRMVADGPLFMAPAGPVRGAIGIDVRQESLEADRFFLAPATGIVTHQSSFVGELERDVNAAFAEFVVPVFSTTTGQRLDLSLAGRVEDYSDFGSTFDPKIGFRFDIASWLSWRGTWGTSFRAPRFNEISPTALASVAIPIPTFPDPQSSTGLSSVIILSGSNQGLEPETAETWSTGFTVEPSDALQIDVNYYTINYTDKILAGGAALNTLNQEALWSDIIERNPSASRINDICTGGTFTFIGTCPATVAAIVDTRLRNLAGIETEGLDFRVRFRQELPLGDLELTFNGNHAFSYDRRVSSSSPITDGLDIVGGPLDFRFRASASWSVGPMTLSGFVNYADDYRSPPATRVDSWTTFDASLSYRFDERRRILFSAINIADEEPPFVNGTTGFDAANASDVGRSVSVSLVASF